MFSYPFKLVSKHVNLCFISYTPSLPKLAWLESISHVVIYAIIIS